MPNYCENKLTITGDASEIDRFIATCITTNEHNERELDFKTIRPIPQGLDYGYPKSNRECLAVALCKVRDNVCGGFEMEKDLTLSELLVLQHDVDHAAVPTLHELNAFIDQHGLEAIAAPSLQRQRTFGYDNGYEFCCAEWGTKWNAVGTTIAREGDTLTLTFDTAWSAPVPIVEATGDMFPTLRFTLQYLETGECFSGTYCCQGDDETFEEHGDISAEMYQAIWGFVPDDEDDDDDDDEEPAVEGGHIAAA